jgi:hypothetical protein
MSTIGSRIRNGRVARLVRNPRTERSKPAAEPSPGETPYWLLWSIGIVAFVLCAVAFVLWGLNGATTFFDMIVALCM